MCIKFLFSVVHHKTLLGFYSIATIYGAENSTRLKNMALCLWVVIVTVTDEGNERDGRVQTIHRKSTYE